jgi:hypothetical protein
MSLLKMLSHRKVVPHLVFAHANGLAAGPYWILPPSRNHGSFAASPRSLAKGVVAWVVDDPDLHFAFVDRSEMFPRPCQ